LTPFRTLIHPSKIFLNDSAGSWATPTEETAISSREAASEISRVNTRPTSSAIFRGRFRDETQKCDHAASHPLFPVAPGRRFARSNPRTWFGQRSPGSRFDPLGHKKAPTQGCAIRLGFRHPRFWPTQSLGRPLRIAATPRRRTATVCSPSRSVVSVTAAEDLGTVTMCCSRDREAAVSNLGACPRIALFSDFCAVSY
jgi:hypothetical protein